MQTGQLVVDVLVTLHDNCKEKCEQLLVIWDLDAVKFRLSEISTTSELLQSLLVTFFLLVEKNFLFLKPGFLDAFEELLRNVLGVGVI